MMEDIGCPEREIVSSNKSAGSVSTEPSGCGGLVVCLDPEEQCLTVASQEAPEQPSNNTTSGSSSDFKAEADSRKNEPASFSGVQDAGQNETALVPPKIATSPGEAESPPPHDESDLETAEIEFDLERNFLDEPEEEPEMSTMSFMRLRCPVCGFLSFYRDRLLGHMKKEGHEGWVKTMRGPLPGLWKRNIITGTRRNCS